MFSYSGAIPLVLLLIAVVAVGTVPLAFIPVTSCPRAPINCKLPRWIKSIASPIRTWYLLKFPLLIFPSLFKEHKIRRAETQENMLSEVIIVLLNRNVHDNSKILRSFFFMSCMIFGASALAFVTSVPLVSTGATCLDNDTSLTYFCYKHDSQYPEDCTNSTNQDGANITYTCYALSLPIFGTAFSAAWGIFKISIVFTTCYVQLGENFLTTFKNRVCNVCKWFTLLLLGTIVIVFLSPLPCDIYNTVTERDLSTMKKYAGYWYLPMWLCLGFSFVTYFLEPHCKQPEYNTLSPDQFPPRDRSVASTRSGASTSSGASNGCAN